MKFKAMQFGLFLTALLVAPIATFGFQTDDAAPAPPEVDASGLIADIEQAKDDFRPIQREEVNQALARLNKALANLQSLLDSLGEEREQQWKDYLDWESLQNLTSYEKGDMPPDEDQPSYLDRVDAALNLFRKGAEGMELPEFLETRRAIINLYYVVDFYENDVADQRGYYHTVIDALKEAIQNYATEPTHETETLINYLVMELIKYHQAPQLAAKIRERFNEPNFYVHFSTRLVAAGMERDVDEPVQSRDCIVGTDVYTEGITRGRVKVAMLPSMHEALLVYRMDGLTHSQSVGYNGPVTVYSHGVTEVHARNPVLLTEQGFVPLKPYAFTKANTVIDQICADCWLISTLAAPQVEKRKPQAEAEASLIAARRAAAQMHEQIDEAMEEANEAYQDDFQSRLRRRDAYPTELNFRSTPSMLTAVALHANRGRLAAPTSAPEYEGRHDMTLHIHESMVRNAAIDAFAGLAMDAEEIAEITRGIDWSGEAEEEDVAAPEDEAGFYTVFAYDQPVVVSFREGMVRIKLEFNELTRGENSFFGATVSATYQFERQNGKIVLRRVGEIEAREVPFGARAPIERRFEKIFPQEYPISEIELKDRWKDAGTLVLEHAAAEQGWLTLGYGLRGE